MSHTFVTGKPSSVFWLVLSGVLPICLLFALGAMHVLQGRTQVLERANEDARQLVRTLEAGVSATMRASAFVADFVAISAREHAAVGQLHQHEMSQNFIEIAQTWPFIQSVSLSNADGDVVHVVLRGADGQLRRTDFFNNTNFLERATFYTHMQATPETDTLYISEIKRGELSRMSVMVLTKGVWDAAGKFLGVATVSIREDAIVNIFKTATPIADGAITLFRSDGLLLFAMPDTKVKVGNIYADSRLFRTAVHEAQEGAYTAFTAEDGIERIFAFRVAPDFPFVIVAAVPVTRVLAGWRRSTLVLVVACVLSALAISLLTISLIRRYKTNRKVQEELRDSQIKLKDLVECSSDYRWETDAQGRVTSINGEGIERFAPLINKRSDEIFVTSAEPHDLQELERLRDARLPIRNLTVPTLGIGGEVRWVRNSANPVFDANGQFRGYRGVGSDVTEVRRQRKIIEAQRKDEALGRLTSGLAHEINNLLQPILIYSESGAAAQKNTAAAVPFVKIRRAAESASAIVKNVLAFARESPPRKTQIELTEVVRETIDVMSARLPESIAVTVDIPAAASLVWVDRTGFAQALTNLMNNAIEALVGVPHDSSGRRSEAYAATSLVTGHIAIAASEIEYYAADARIGLKPGRYCRLTVTDNGPGIPHDSLESVFDPFFTTKPQGQGTGLGLSVVLGLTKSWGGAVDVKSVPGEGTTFILYLPLAERHMQAAQ